MRGVGIAVGLPPMTPLAEFGRVVLQRVIDHGFDYAEISGKSLSVIFNGQLHPTRRETLTATLAGLPLRYTLHGTEVSSSKGGNLLDTTTATQEATVGADIDLASAIGAEVMVYHSGTLRDPYGDDRALAAGLAAERDALKRLGDRAAELGVTIAVENRDPVARYIIRRAYGLDLLQLAEQIAAVDHPNVAICLDTGHAYLAYSYLDKRDAYLEDIRQIAPLVGHIHLTDNFGNVQLDADADYTENLTNGNGDLHLPPGWGAIPLADVFAIPFPRDPAVILEVQPRFLEHATEAVATTRSLIGQHAFAPA